MLRKKRVPTNKRSWLSHITGWRPCWSKTERIFQTTDTMGSIIHGNGRVHQWRLEYDESDEGNTKWFCILKDFAEVEKNQ